MSKFTDEDIFRFWAAIGLENEPLESFKDKINYAVAEYRYREESPPKIAEKVRNEAYNPLENAIMRIKKQLSDPDDWLTMELAEASMDFEPEDFGDPRVMDLGDYEGLDYSDVKRFMILDQLSELSDIIAVARKSGTRKRGREKQNASLEATLLQLANIFSSFTNRSALEGYSQDVLDSERPYKGGFFDLAYAVIWTFNGSNIPAGAAIGDAARRALNAKK